MTLKDHFLSNIRSETGAVAVMLMVSLPMILAFLAIVTEVGYLRLKGQSLQASADAAVFAAAITKNRGGTPDATLTAARDAAASVYGSYPSVVLDPEDPNDTSKVRVTLTAVETPVLLPNFIAEKNISLVRSAALKVAPGDVPVCLHALEKTADKALFVSGNQGSLNLVNCNFHSASTHNSGVTLLRDVLAYCASIGGTTLRKNGTLRLDCNIDPIYQAALDDPLATRDLSPPAELTSRPLPALNAATNTRSFLPGSYSGAINITGTENLSFAPGIYVFTNTLRISTSGRVTGDGVTLIYAPASSTVRAEFQKARFQLNPPSDGPFKDIVFHVNPPAGVSPLTVKIINLDIMTDFSGYFYNPTGTLVVDGDTSLTIGCPKFIARFIEVTGNAKMRINCPGLSFKLDLVE